MASTHISESGPRRKFPRRRFQRKLGVLIDGRYWMANGIEIGEGGLSFSLGQRLDEGNKLVVNFQVPGGSFVSVTGEIVNLRQDEKSGLFHYGVAFRTLKFEAKKEIRTFVSTRTQLEN